MDGAVRVCRQMPEWYRQFRESQGNNNLYVVHFHYRGSSSSIELGQRFDAMAVNHPNVFFLRVDMDGCKEAANKYRVRAHPEVHFLKNGKRIKGVQRMTREVPLVPPATEKTRVLKHLKVEKVEQQILLLSV